MVWLWVQFLSLSYILVIWGTWKPQGFQGNSTYIIIIDRVKKSWGAQVCPCEERCGRLEHGDQSRWEAMDPWARSPADTWTHGVAVALHLVKGLVA